LPRSVFYYQIKTIDKVEPYAIELEKIKSIFAKHKGRYGYRRIHLALRKQGTWLNHKTVQRLMEKLGLKSMVRAKKYSSYKGEQFLVPRLHPIHLCLLF